MDNVGWFSVTPEAVALHQAGPAHPDEGSVLCARPVNFQGCATSKSMLAAVSIMHSHVL